MKFWRKKQASRHQPELIGEDDWDTRMSRADALPQLLAQEDGRDQAVSAAIELASDESYYIAEKAVYALAACSDASRALITVMEAGSDQAQVLALQAVRKMAEERPDADLIHAAADLLRAPVSATSFVATKTLMILSERLQEKSTSARDYLVKNLQELFPSLIDRFADKLFVRSDVAGHVTDLCKLVPATIDLVIQSLDDSRAEVREGAARTICRLDGSTSEAMDTLNKRITNEANWAARVWAAAAWEAVRGAPLPEDRWPVVAATWKMVFFETENDDDVPTGVRFESDFPLTGVLNRESGYLLLYWPEKHGVLSSDKLLDDYRPIIPEGLADDVATDLLGQEVDITGTYRKHRISVETIERR